MLCSSIRLFGKIQGISWPEDYNFSAAISSLVGREGESEHPLHIYREYMHYRITDCSPYSSSADSPDHQARQLSLTQQFVSPAASAISAGIQTRGLVGALCAPSLLPEKPGHMEEMVPARSFGHDYNLPSAATSTLKQQTEEREEDFFPLQRNSK